MKKFKDFKKKFPAQIMIIVLVFMSILSIIALSATLTSVRDTEEKVQNTQYQQYYSVGEQMLLSMQQEIGRAPIPTGAIEISGNTDVDLDGVCTLDASGITTCTFDNISPSQFNNTGTAEELKTDITIIDSNTFDDFTLYKDKDLLIDLEGHSEGQNISITLSWSKSSPVAWNFTIDTLDGDNYSSEKAVYNNINTIGWGVGPYTEEHLNYTGTCFSFITPTEVPTDKLSTTITILSDCSSRMFFRLRPLLGGSDVNVDIDLEITGNTLPLMRTLKSITTTSSSGGSGQTDNPTAVLETRYSVTSGNSLES